MCASGVFYYIVVLVNLLFMDLFFAHESVFLIYCSVNFRREKVYINSNSVLILKTLLKLGQVTI